MITQSPLTAWGFQCKGCAKCKNNGMVANLVSFAGTLPTLQFIRLHLCCAFSAEFGQDWCSRGSILPEHAAASRYCGS